jgi:hypothetical protein
MNMMTWRGLVSAVALATVCLGISACNTSKATIDTFAKFTSSTSPGDWINGDGMVVESQKARLFTAVAFENLEQDIARGQGEYLTSLAVLLKVPAREQDDFKTSSRNNYPLLFASDERTAEGMLATLKSTKEDQSSGRQ